MEDEEHKGVYMMGEEAKNIQLYRIMHKYGKLASCDSNKPNTSDKMFLEEFKKNVK